MPTKRVVIGSRELALDARADRLDLRDRPYHPPLGSLPPEWPPREDIHKVLPAYAANGLILDQGEDGACTGFGLAAVVNYLLFVRGLALGEERVRKVSPAILYQLARLYDEWPGEDYEGSSCRGALRGWHRHGVCRDQLWPYRLDKQGRRVYVTPTEDAEQPDNTDRNWDVDALSCTLGVYYRIDVRSIVDMQAAIRYSGAIYASAMVHEGWAVRARKRLENHDDLVRIKLLDKPKQAGGHAFALVGYSSVGFVVQNSWGGGWGSHGFALLPYEEWIAHGRDAWVFTLGVPGLSPAANGSRGNGSRGNGATAGVARSPRYLVPFGSREDRAATERPTGLITADDGLIRRYRGVTSKGFLPLEADVAYRHAILLDRGLPIRNDITAENAIAALNSAVIANPAAWLKERKSTKLLIYAHGGLNSENDSITRVRVMAPYALANGIYPLFITWRSGPLETLSDLVEENMEKYGVTEATRSWLDRVTDTTDGMLETVLRGPGGALWGQMKTNATRASDDAQGGVAPACTVRFALDHYAAAVQHKVLAAKDFHIHVLSDQNELNDRVGPYRKSLLYLVSRAFEDVHKMPLLGMVKSFDPDSVQPRAADDLWARDQQDEVADWQAFWNSLGVPASNLDVLSARGVSNGVRVNQSAHGAFDNSIDIIGRAFGYIVNPASPVKLKIERLDY